MLYSEKITSFSWSHFFGYWDKLSLLFLWCKVSFQSPGLKCVNTSYKSAKESCKCEIYGQIVQECNGFSCDLITVFQTFWKEQLSPEGLHLTDSICQRAAWFPFTGSGLVLSKTFWFHVGRQVGSVLHMQPSKSEIISMEWSTMGTILSVCPVTPARLHKVRGVELRGLGAEVSGCSCSASETHSSALWRCGERGLFCLQNIQETDCIQVLRKKHTILQQHWQLCYWGRKNVSNVAKYLLLMEKSLTPNALDIDKGYLCVSVGNMAACRPGLKHWIRKWPFRVSVKNVTNFEKFFILPKLQLMDNFHCVWVHT